MGARGKEAAFDRHAKPSPTKVSGATNFADPEDRAYPLDTPEHRHAAASLFGMHKEKYAPAKRAEIERNIEQAT